MKVEMVPLSNLKPLFTRSVDAEGLDELAQSIRFAGIMEPLVVRKSDYGIIADFRRYLAAKKAVLSEVPCVLVDCDDAEAFRLSLIENIQRENLSDYEMAKCIREFKDKTGFTDEQIANLLGKGRTWVTDHLRMLNLENLPNVSRETLEMLDEHHARTILSQPEEIREPPSVREIERKAKELLKPPEEEVEGVESIEEVLEAAERVVSAPDSGDFVKLESAEDVDRFFDEVLKIGKTDEKITVECPSGCGWSVEIDWKKRDYMWITP